MLYPASKAASFNECIKFGLFDEAGVPVDTAVEPKDFDYDLFNFGWSPDESRRLWEHNKDDLQYSVRTRYHDIPGLNDVKSCFARALLSAIGAGALTHVANVDFCANILITIINIQ